MMNHAPNRYNLVCVQQTALCSRGLTLVLVLSLFTHLGCDDEGGGGGGPVQRGLSPAQLKRLQSSPSPNTQKKKKAQGSTQSQNMSTDLSKVLVIPNRLKRAGLMRSSGWDDFKRIRERLKNARDPFWPDIPELKDQDEVEIDPTSVQRKLVVKVPENALNLKFQGTLTGRAANLAMLVDGSGAGYTVRVGDIIGKPPEFVRVKMITNNKIIFEPVLGVNENEPKDSPRLLKVLREGEEQRATELGVE